MCALFHPHTSTDFSQKPRNCSRNSPVGHAYNMYSLGWLSSRVGSCTCASSQSEASCTPLFPVAASAFSLRQEKQLFCHPRETNLESLRPVLREPHLQQRLQRRQVLPRDPRGRRVLPRRQRGHLRRKGPLAVFC